MNINKRRKGISIIELIISVVISLIVMLAAGMAIADGVNGFRRAFDKTNSEVAVQAYTAQKAFDRIVRKSSYVKNPLLGTNSLDVYYMDDPNHYGPDRRAHFWVDVDVLKMSRFSYPASDPLGTEMLAQDVVSCVFKINGRSAQMILKLDNGAQQIATIGSGYIHN